MEQTQLKKYDFNKALKSGYSKSQIVNSLRNDYNTNLDWEKINEDFKGLKPKERDEALFDSLYNNQDIWGISGIKTKEPPKALQNRILSDNQIQDIHQEVEKLPQWAIESSLKPQIIGEAFGLGGFWKLFQNKEEIARDNALKDALDRGITQKLEKGEDLSIGEMMRYYQANEGMQGYFSPKAHYQKQQELKKIAQTDFENLDESQKQELLRQNKITRLWNSKRELHDKLKDEVTKKETDAYTRAKAEQLERDIINLERTYKNILKSGVDFLNDSTEQSDRYKEMIQESAISLGFDGIGFKGDRIYAFKGDKAIFVDDGFFHNLGQILGTNAFDIGGSITGALAGAKRGTGKIGKLAGAIAGGAVGAGLGGIADSIIAQFNARGEVNLADALLTGAESATFDIAGGLIVSGGAKAVKGAVKGTQKLLNLNPLPIVSVVKNSIGSENIQAAKEIVEQTFTQEQKDDILAFSKSFGGNLELEGKDTLLTKSAEFLTQKYGADSKIAKAANALENYSKAHNKAQAREEMLTLIRADDKGQSLGILLEVARNSTLANKNLREILNATSYKLKKEIESLGLKPNIHKEVFNDLEKGTKEDYDEAFNKILGELYGDEKVVLNGEAYAKMREDMGELIELDPQGLGFLHFVEKRIYNPNGVNITQLGNARKLLNSYYKSATNPSTKDFINNVAESAIRGDIQEGVNKILLTKPELYENAKRICDTALSDYATMKETINALDDLKFDDLAKTNAELTDNLINFIQGDGGRKEINNYELLTKGLKKEQIESLELNALNRIYEKNLLKDSGDSTFEVFNSAKFLEDTARLREIFQSENAKKFIEIMQGFNRLFGNDAKIALNLGFANPPKEGSAIAQSVEGAVKQKIVKGIFGILMRNLPTSNKVWGDVLGLKERVQKMALAHHIEQALKSAYSINDFTFALKKISDDPNTPSPTRQAIMEFSKDLTRLAEEARENADISKNAEDLQRAIQETQKGEPLAEFGTNYSEFYHKGSEAIEHLLQTKSGQVQGAFYRKDLEELSGNGDITLVWGDEKAGLAHILARRKEDFINQGFSTQESEQKALEFIQTLPEIIERGEIEKGSNRIFLNTDNKRAVVALDFKGEQNKWIITAYQKELKANASAYPHQNTQSLNTSSPIVEKPSNPNYEYEKGLSVSSKPLTETDSLASNSSDIIPQPQKSTQSQEAKAPTLQEKIQILKEKRRQELEAAIKARQEKAAQESQALREAQQAKQKIKDAQVGKAINEIDLKLEGKIATKELKPTILNLENKSYPAKFVIIKKEDLKPNFETKGTQGRTQKQENVIQDIQENLNPNKLFFSEGGFEGLPIILKDGQVSVGNHRAQALKNLSQESLASYQKSAKEVFGVDLKDDELIVRMLDENIPNEEILSLSFASNVGREQNLSEKALSTLGKYQENLDKLPQNIYAQSVEEMQQIVAKSLDKTNNGLNTFDTNLALFSSLAKSKDKNILDALNAISGDAERKAKVVKMFVENAGNFHNLAKQTQMPNLDLRDYLTQALYFTAKADSSRVENFKELAQEIKSIIQTTDAQGKNALIQEESHYNELIGKALGYSFARFRELENPSGSFFDFLNNIKLALSEELEPTLFSAGRPLSSADIYDFLSVSIKSGIPSDKTSEVLELLPQLKAKHEAVKADSLQTQGIKEANQSTPPASLQKQPESSVTKVGDPHLQNKTQNEVIPQTKNHEQTIAYLQNAIKEAEQKQPYKAQIKPILESLQQEWAKDKDRIVLHWRERVKGKFVKRTPNLKSEDNIRNTLEVYKDYKGEDASKEINMLQNALDSIEAEKNKAKQSKKDIEAEIQDLQAKLQEQISKINNLDIFTDITHQRLKLYSNKYQSDNAYINKLIKEGFNADDALNNIKSVRESIQNTYNLSPLKEFGTNYAEYYHDGKRAIQKILAEAKDYETRKLTGEITESEAKQGTYKGQVAGALYRKDLEDLSGNGEIDLVWGEITDKANHKGYGLAHIMDKHPEFDLNLIPQIVENGKLVNLNNGKIRIVTNQYTIGMKKEWEGKPTNAYILTAFENTKESAKNLHSSTLTKGESLPLNSNGIIPQSTKEAIDPADRFAQPIQVRGNTLPTYKPDEIIDVEIINAEPRLQKQITYKRHNLRAKIIQSLQVKLEALKPYPQKQIEYKRLESQVNTLVEKQHKELQQPSLFSKEDLGKNPQNSIIQNKTTKGEEYGTADSNKSGEISTGDNQLARIGDDDFKQNQGEIQLEGRNREQGKANRQHTQTIPQKSTKQDSSGGGMGGKPSISSNRSGSLQENPRGDRLGQNRNPRSRECLFVANGKRGVGSTKSTSRGFGNATENLRVSDRLTDNIQSTDNPQGLLSPAQKAEINQRYKPAEIIETGNAKQIVKHNLKAIQTLAELLENNTLATNEQKDLLHNFRGFGKASNEMLEIMRNPQNKTAQEFKAALQKINEIAGTKLDLIQIIRTFQDSYYTPQPIVRQMVGLLKDRIANLPSFNVLEPSVGVGRFLGELPSSANIYAVERDELSALLAKNIYPHAKVETSDFQKSNIANIENAFDLVIGNPPYSSTILRDEKGISGTAHNYFLQKSIKSLRPNGISIQIVTHNFLDSNNSKYRELISKEAKFLGAVRLPSGTFKDTEVITDIVAFRKLNEGENAEDLWVKSSKINENVFINDYFKRNPHHILGETKVIKNQFGNETLQVSNPSFDINSFDLNKYIPLDEQSLKGYTLGDEIIKPTENVSTQRAVGEVTIQNGKFYKYLNNKAGSQIEFNPHQMLSEITTWSESTIKKAVENYQNDFPKIQTLKSELENLRYLENSVAEDAEIESARARLNAAYDDLLKGYSFKNESGGFRERFRAFVMLDDTAFELLALEKGILTKEVNGKTKIIGSQKADIFTQRQIYPYKPPLSAQNLNDAVTIAKNETGKIDIQRINTLLERGEDELQKTQEELLNEKFLFLDSKGEIVEKADFLSGNVKQKLQSFKDESGEVRFSEDEKKAKFQKIAYESLKEVQPIDIDIADVTIPLGANWIPKEIHEQFLQELGMREISLQYEPQIGWLAKGTGHNNNEYIINTSKEFRDATGVKEINALNYIEKMFNNNELLVQRTVTKGETTHTYKDPIATRALQNAKVRLQKEFKSFIVDREDLLQDTQKRFNDLFNAEVPKTYDGGHLSFIGMNRNIHLRPHQKNAVYRILTSSNTLLAHAVGTGKTYTLASSVMEANRLGQARKSMIVLPNYLTTQFATEARQLYPNAKIAVVNGINKKLKNRQLEQLKNNQYDLIVTTYTAFKEMDISRDYFQKIINEEVYDAERLLAKLQEEKAPKRQIKGLITRIDNLRQKAILREEKLKKEGVNVFFDDLGLDGLYFDEAHYLKSLPITTRQPNVRGINTRESERAMDALMKIRQMQDFSKKVVFSTGTPVTNYVSDIYIMQKYLSPNKLKERGVERFDDWCSMFAEASTEFELKPTGDYAETTRLRRITNLIELNKMYFDFTDLITKEEMKEAMENMGIKNVEPKVIRKQSVNELSKGQVAYLEEIYHRAEELKRNPEIAFMKGGDNHLKIINDARKASLDLRLVNPNAPRDEKSKVVQCANNIKEIYDRYNEDLGTQLVFLDLSTPKRTLSPARRAKITKEYEQIMESIELGKATSVEEAEKLQAKAQSLGELLEMSGNSFSLYDELKTLLKEKGIKEDEIAFIHDYDAKKGAFSKEALSDKINSGKIRILIGSTGKMGAGCNFQERLVALHHLDLDWTPANMEQREGRIIRQGNKLLEKYGENFEVEIHNYITKNSSDSIMLQTLENKQRIIKQMQDKTLRVREVVDDSEDDIYGMLQALGSENGEEILEMLKLSKNINLITNELESFDTKLKSTTAQLSFAKANIKNLETQKSLLQNLEKMPLESLNIQGKEYLLSGEKTREKFNQALSARVDKFSNSIDNVGEIATIGEYKILAKKDSKYIIFRIGKDLKENVGLFHFEVNNRATTDYYRRFSKEFKEIVKGEAQREIDIKIQSAHATRQRHEKTLKNLNSEDRQNLETKLNAHKARYKELEDIIKAKESTNDKGTNLESNAYLGIGLASGSVAGFENNGEELELNAQDFTTALILGTFGGKVSASMLKKIANNPRAMETITRISKYKERLKNGKSNFGNLKDIVFKDKNGKERILRTKIQKQWLKTFNLKSIDDSYIPNQSKEIKEALGNKEIRLQLGSLKKLVAQGREDFIPQIKEVLDEPEAILKDSNNAFLFAKHLKDEDYFVNVSVDKGEYLVSISNGIKEANNIQNKLSNGAEVVYQSPNASSNLQTLLQASRYSTNKIDDRIIPQTTLKTSLESKKAQRRAELESKIVKNQFSDSLNQK